MKLLNVEVKVRVEVGRGEKGERRGREEGIKQSAQSDKKLH